jgi:microcompartment protein EutL
MSLTRALMAELARRFAAGERPAPVRGTPDVAPPARVYVAARESSRFGERAAQHTTAILGIGAVGTRYATDVVLQFQAELAVAHGAVAAELSEGWAEQHGLVALQSRATSHREFLLRPDLGRRLDDASLAAVKKLRAGGVDVQIILADGLSATACMAGGEALYAATRAACLARGLTVGPPLCAKFARVWLEDEIGQELGAKVAMILLGERPGLGTGDGLSAYLVYEPQLGKTDGDRNMMSNLHARGTTAEEAAPRLAALAAAMIAQRRSGVSFGRGRRRPRLPRAASTAAPGRARRGRRRRRRRARPCRHARRAPMSARGASILTPILPTVLAVRRLPGADAALLTAYGADPSRHRALGLITCDQDDSLYVALDEATKHAAVDVVYARSFYAGAAHASGRLSGEVLGVLAGADPQAIEDGLFAVQRTLAHDACFYDADGKGTVTVFPHVIGAIGSYLAAMLELPLGEPLAYLVAPPLEFTFALDAALKAADVRAVKIAPPPSETNFAAAYLTGTLSACEAAAAAFAAAVVDVALTPAR